MDFRRKANRPGTHIRSTSPRCRSFHLIWSLVAARREVLLGKEDLPKSATAPVRRGRLSLVPGSPAICMSRFRRVGPASNASAGPPCLRVNGGPARLSRLSHPTSKVTVLIRSSIHVSLRTCPSFELRKSAGTKSETPHRGRAEFAVGGFRWS